MQRPVRFTWLLFLLLLTTTGWAQDEELTIEITQGVEGAIPIAIVPFAGPTGLPADIAAVVRSDLTRSGRFDPLAPESFSDRPSTLSETNLDAWRDRRQDYLTVGSIRPVGPEQLQVDFQLADVLQRQEMLNLSYTVQSRDLRRLAHEIADQIYEAITGEPGAFNTQIAYVSVLRLPGGSATYTLSVADSDGHSPRTVLRSAEPIMSPAWAPDGNRLAYVSFENRRPVIMVHDIYSGQRRPVADYNGINGAPAWSPDGSRLAFTLSKDGNPEIYVQTLGGGTPLRLTNNSAIDTEPAWLPDGSGLVFTSDRGGGPQIYRTDVGGGRATRLTFEGDYNASPTVSPDGSQIAMVHRRDGRFHIGLQSLQGGGISVLSAGNLDESPSFSPDGQMIIYASSQGGRSVLSLVSTDGSYQSNLVTQDGGVQEPTWSPDLP